MSDPRVSICLPNLNSYQYLHERMASIQAQSFRDWELIICDNYSDDGAWEFFKFHASLDARIKIEQADREGMYVNWNNCIIQAKGEFVYVATSDDTMANDCLAKLVAALDENLDCDLSHCPMRVIDENGAPGKDWWSGGSLFARSAPTLLEYRHKRVAPLDGILCLLGDNIYSSVTQLLIRRSLFDKIGYYKADWGSLGDFHWNLRAGLSGSTVHVPDTWGGWRMHPRQATAAVDLNSAEHQSKIDDMIKDVIRNLDPDARTRLDGLLERSAELKFHLRDYTSKMTNFDRRLNLIRKCLLGSWPAFNHLVATLPTQRSWPHAAPCAVRSWFSQEVLVPLP